MSSTVPPSQDLLSTLPSGPQNFYYKKEDITSYHLGHIYPSVGGTEVVKNIYINLKKKQNCPIRIHIANPRSTNLRQISILFVEPVYLTGCGRCRKGLLNGELYYKCNECPNSNLCDSCFKSPQGPINHSFTPSTISKVFTVHSGILYEKTVEADQRTITYKSIRAIQPNGVPVVPAPAPTNCMAFKWACGYTIPSANVNPPPVPQIVSTSRSCANAFMSAPSAPPRAPQSVPPSSASSSVPSNTSSSSVLQNDSSKKRKTRSSSRITSAPKRFRYEYYQ